MTEKEAKELCIEVWEYLTEHLEFGKEDLPGYLYHKIENMSCKCPLCEYFNCRCVHCPIGRAGQKCTVGTSHYFRWDNACCIEERQEHAKGILGIVKAWDIGEE